VADATDTVPAPKSGPSLVIQIAVLLVLTLVAAGIGYVSGGTLQGAGGAAPAAEAEAAGGHGEAASGGHGEASGGHGGESGGHGDEAAGHGEEGEATVNTNPLILPLPAITTNLAAPTETWVRMEVDVILDKPTTDTNLAEMLHQDLLAYMRTVKMHQIEGASGFQHLKADMEERASLRSGGLVKMVLIKTLIFE
jgi:flagellar FliL protein